MIRTGQLAPWQSKGLVLICLCLFTGAWGTAYSRPGEDTTVDTGNCPTSPLVQTPTSLRCKAPRNWYTLKGDYAPWSQPPLCIDAFREGEPESYCIFAKKDFAGGRGISIVSTPAIAKTISELLVFQDPNVIEEVNHLSTGQFGPPGFQVITTRDKGIGLVSNRSISRGERIMQESVPWIYHRSLYTSLSAEDRIPLQWHGVYMLPEETRKEILDLHVHHDALDDQLDNIMRTNAFGAYYESEALHNNILPRISRINHDCRPNAHYYFDPQTMTQYVHALREIPPGDEILVSYTDAESEYEERQQAITASWGFACSCSICRQPADHINLSDKRLRLIKSLKDELNNWTEPLSQRAQKAELLIDLYNQERLLTTISTGYEAAAYAYSVEGNEAMTQLYAAKAVDALTIMYGGEHELTMDLETMMLNPKEHRTWLYDFNNSQMETGER